MYGKNPDIENRLYIILSEVEALQFMAKYYERRIHYAERTQYRNLNET